MKVSPKKGPEIKKALMTVPLYGAILISLIWVLFPVYWAFSTSLKPEGAIFSIPPRFITSELTLEHYLGLFTRYPFSSYFVNSITITIGTLIVSVMFGSIAAYGFSRYEFPGSKYLLSLIVLSRMIPPVAYVIPLYVLIWSFGLVDTHLGVILAHCSIVLPFTIWIMKGFFDELPRDFEEAAMVDGCSRLGALRVALRLALPGLGVAAIFGFVESWNEFMFALTITRSPASLTVPVGLAMLLERPWRIPWGEITAGAALFTIPIFILGYFIEKYIARAFVLGTVR